MLQLGLLCQHHSQWPPHPDLNTGNQNPHIDATTRYCSRCRYLSCRNDTSTAYDECFRAHQTPVESAHLAMWPIPIGWNSTLAAGAAPAAKLALAFCVQRVYSDHNRNTQFSQAYDWRDAMTTAFVLSGGGIRGRCRWARSLALLERGIVPDMMVGTSAGSLNSGFMAAQGRCSRRSRN